MFVEPAIDSPRGTPSFLLIARLQWPSSERRVISGSKAAFGGRGLSGQSVTRTDWENGGWASSLVGFSLTDHMLDLPSRVGWHRSH
jgi:hypothetical protein